MTNIRARRIMTALTIQWAWSNRRWMSRFAASVDAAENPGIMSPGDSMHDGSGSNRECRATGAVAWRTRVASVTLCLAVHGCATGTGGAVELSWKLRPASSASTDKFVDCQPDSTDDGWGPVTAIRLDWRVGDAAGSHDWTCSDNHGATGFDLPVGVADLLVTPECGDAEHRQPAAQDTYIAPATLQRRVTRGETVSL